MKQIYRVVALAIFTAFLAGCAGTGMEPGADAAKASAKEDTAIKADVSAALAKEPQLKGAYIFPAVKDGEVSLSGVARNDWMKYLAEKITKSTKGVKSVKNNVKVE
tara:strand:+ start:384582 stop:384899 length:318 start_codon:yes stop_codon:yes gene_type:complete